MGGFNAFEDLNPSQVISIRGYAQQFYNSHQKRPYVVLDMSSHIVQVSTESRSRNEGVAHHSLFRRLSAYLKVGCDLFCVFDGPLETGKRRHKDLASVAQISAIRQFSPMIQYAKDLCVTMGIPFVDAPSEAEALCAWLQREGHVDAVFSGDADVLANGATRVLRYVPPQHSLSSSSGVRSLSAEERLIEVYELSLDDAPQFAMMALILGNDWAEGIRGVGKTTALALSRPQTGFAHRLIELARLYKSNSVGDRFVLELKRLQWHDDFVNELTTNEHQWLSRKCNQLIPESFPDLKLFCELIQLELTYDPYFANVCHDSNIISRRPLVPENRPRIQKLQNMWHQPCPGSVSSSSRDEGSDERSDRLFKSTLASLLLANMLIHDVQTVSEIEFKEVNKKMDVQVTKAPPVPPFDSEFLVGARVMHSIFDRCVKASLTPKPKPKPRAKPAPKPQSERAGRANSLKRAAVRQNSKITEFFAPRRSQSDSALPEGPRPVTRHEPLPSSCAATTPLLKKHCSRSLYSPHQNVGAETDLTIINEENEDTANDTDVDDENDLDCQVLSVSQY